MPYLSPLRRPKIYAYSDIRYPDCLKVGYTAKSVKERVEAQFPVKQPGQSYRIELDEDAVRDDGSFFTDHDVHKVLLKHGVKRVKGEWFECTVEDVQTALLELKTGVAVKKKAIFNFGMRPEQQSAVEKTADYFQRFTEDPMNKGKIPHFLWNAKMRFGKTFAAYQLAKKNGLEKGVGFDLQTRSAKCVAGRFARPFGFSGLAFCNRWQRLASARRFSANLFRFIPRLFG